MCHKTQGIAQDVLFFLLCLKELEFFSLFLILNCPNNHYGHLVEDFFFPYEQFLGIFYRVRIFLHFQLKLYYSLFLMNMCVLKVSISLALELFLESNQKHIFAYFHFFPFYLYLYLPLFVL